MTPQQLEAKVLAAVELLQSGQRVEDDVIECKADWPKPDKARQLAACCNRAAGAEVIWILGVDDKTGTVQKLKPIDVATWWPQTRSQFDGTPPDLLRHLNVKVAAGQVVVALNFATILAPYVVNMRGERDVPMRDATGTRSATRKELHNLLVAVDRGQEQARKLTWWLEPTDAASLGRREFADGAGFFVAARGLYDHVDLVINNRMTAACMTLGRSCRDLSRRMSVTNIGAGRIFLGRK